MTSEFHSEGHRRHRREIVERLLAQWERLPGCRLGQLFSNALGLGRTGDLFYLTDEELLELVKRHVDAFAD